MLNYSVAELRFTSVCIGCCDVVLELEDEHVLLAIARIMKTITAPPIIVEQPNELCFGGGCISRQ